MKKYFMQNTPIYDEHAYRMYNELKEYKTHTKQYRKSIALVAAMRLKCHRPDQSLEILSIHDDIDVNIRYVRILSHAHLNQFDQVFRLLKLTLQSSHTDKTIKIPEQLVRLKTKNKIRKTFTVTIEFHVCFDFLQIHKVENKLKKLDDDKLNEQYQMIYNELKRLDLILTKVTSHTTFASRKTYFIEKWLQSFFILFV